MEIYEPVEQARELAKFLKKLDRWGALCDALTAAPEDSAAYAAAEDAWRKGRRNMPSKNAKHRAYANADAVRRYLVARGHTMERGTNVEYLKSVLATARMEGLK